MGIFGGVAIVLPYLLPFLIGLAVLEDSGYLPRVAFLMDKEIAKYKLPERLETLPEFPVSTFGKVSKKALVEMITKKLEQEKAGKA